jgi:hypothetical protein
MSRSRPSTAPPENDLSSLIDHERALERRLDETRAAAEQRIARARQEAAARDDELAAEIARARAAIDAEIAGRTETRLAEITEHSARETARYRALTGGALEQLATALVDRLARDLTGDDL